jgi:hypothetical protein
MLRCCGWRGRRLRRGRTWRLAMFRRCRMRRRWRCGVWRRRWRCRMRRWWRCRVWRRRRRCRMRWWRRCRMRRRRWRCRMRRRRWRCRFWRCRLCCRRRGLLLFSRRRRRLRQQQPSFAVGRGGETRGLETQQGGAGQQKCRHGILRQARIHTDWVPGCSVRSVDWSQRSMCVQSKALQRNSFPRREIIFAPSAFPERPFIEARSCGPARARCPGLRR